MSWNGTVSCSFCWKSGHNKRSCPKLQKEIAENPNGWDAQHNTPQPRKCSYCKNTKHTRRTCQDRKLDMSKALRINTEYCNRVRNFIVERGLGIGSLVTYQFDEKQCLSLVKDFHWDRLDFQAYENGYNGNIIEVEPVSATNRKHYLRFPTESKLFSLEDSGHIHIDDIISPIPGDMVEKQIDASWLKGTINMDVMFADSQHEAPTHLIEILWKEFELS